jgi:exodeoxyribonuclease V gamma subunit
MPGFFIFTSNRMEVLAERLAEVLRAPRSAPMTPETIIVQSRGMERWLSMELARLNGISANVRFPFPNAFLESAFRAVADVAPTTSAFDPDATAFRIMGLIDAHSRRPEFDSLRHYLAEDPQAVKRYQLARKIADLFDQYLVFRPEMIARWEAGQNEPSEHHRWQALLWRELARAAPGAHRAAQRRLLAEAVRRGDARLAALPGRVFLFGVSYLPRFHLELLAELSETVEVHAFCMNPCREYWADIVSERAVHRWRRRTGDFEGVESRLHLERGNRLLASLGTLGRHFLDALTEVSGVQDEGFVAPESVSLLGRVQSDILDLRDARRTDGLSADGSILIHACHSPMREAEVLRDQLLAMFEADPQLRPADVIVMTPDIEACAQYVSAVFGAPGAPGQRIPFCIADRGPHRESGCLQAFFHLLDLRDSRFGAGEVLRLLESPEVRRRFRLADAQLPLLEQWVRAAGICWGEDETTLQSLGLPAHRHHTWRAGIERLLLGYALPPRDVEVFHGIRGCDAFEGTTARTMGPFLDFLDQVFAFSARLREPRRLAAWREEINAMLAAFFPADEEEPADLQRLRGLMEELAGMEARADFLAAVPLETVRIFLSARLDGEGAGRGFMSGGVTFCSMLPMRAIPFQVVCLIGMNHDAYPRDSRHLSFDLIAQAPRPGDRSRRNDDKYLFLEALLSARRRLYISYVGQSLQDNSRVPPSVVVSELLDALQTGYGLPVDDPLRPLVTFHPLQPFSPHYFSGGPTLFSYSAEDLQAAAAAAAPQPATAFIPEPLPLTTDETAAFRRLDIGRLVSFFANPARFLLTERLGVRLEPPSPAPADREPFSLSGLERFTLGTRLLDQRLNGCTAQAAFDALRADGRLPPGTAGEVAFRGLWAEVDRFAGRLDALRPVDAPQALDLRWDIAGFELTAHLAGISGRGCLRYRFGSLRAKDQLDIWLQHLALCRSAPAGRDIESVFVGTDRTLRLTHVSDSPAVMEALVRLYGQGLERPLCFFPKAALEYAGALRKSFAPERALAAARGIWEGGDQHPGESADPYYQRCFEAIEPLGVEFETLSRQVFDPFLDHASSERPS